MRHHPSIVRNMDVSLQHPELKNKCIPMAKEHISASQWKVILTLFPFSNTDCYCVCLCQAVQEYQAYKDYELPPTYQGDFHGNRREERNRFLLQVMLFEKPHPSCYIIIAGDIEWKTFQLETFHSLS